MRRRRLLALAGTGLAGGLAGCTAGYQGDTEATEDDNPATPTPGRGNGVDLPVSPAEIYTAIPEDRIAAITDPAFANDWSGLDIPPDAELQGLADETAVIGIERDGRARAYPLAILDWHEIVNDTFGGPLLVTYCPLCGSAVVAERTAGGKATTFGVSGKLWRNNLVLYDERTRSLWSQLLATAIQGELTGERLTLVPSTFTSWGTWRDTHPETGVLLPPPHSNTVRGRGATEPYFDSKYNYEQEDQLVGYDSADGDLTRRTLVVGVTADGIARAYPFPVVREEEVVLDRVGDRPVVVTHTPDGGLVAYDRRVDGRTLTFAADGPAHLKSGDTRWERATGQGVSGRFGGRELASASPVPALFWSAWADFYPETEVYGMDVEA
ncbi:DUF3179 domain-containing protein [Halosegnis sp.]|uniref:DUF3179 domain-containing protein n=1 Tax=Halosegnis sp. TaxID=2864959 RepID=UPI0035D503F6